MHPDAVAPGEPVAGALAHRRLDEQRPRVSELAAPTALPAATPRPRPGRRGPRSPRHHHPRGGGSYGGRGGSGVDGLGALDGFGGGPGPGHRVHERLGDDHVLRASDPHAENGRAPGAAGSMTREVIGRMGDRRPRLGSAPVTTIAAAGGRPDREEPPVPADQQLRDFQAVAVALGADPDLARARAEQRRGEDAALAAADAYLLVLRELSEGRV